MESWGQEPLLTCMTTLHVLPVPGQWKPLAPFVDAAEVKRAAHTCQPAGAGSAFLFLFIPSLQVL